MIYRTLIAIVISVSIIFTMGISTGISDPFLGFLIGAVSMILVLIIFPDKE